ncbi:MAG TPA: exodeoxyribonuclease VII large subunit [Geminicoccaceae bacterium]|nr:exodeoxyribonuclease VII large subunit [Geminicoccaceae bacterium]
MIDPWREEEGEPRTSEARTSELEAGNVAEYSVSELAAALKRTLEDGYGYVRVRGEISGFKRAGSGHLYFALKDAGAVLDAVCWRSTAQRLRSLPADGLEVVATGRITTYPSRSRYQLIVERLEPAGIGALMALLDERRRKLAAEGLFAAERKRPLPFLPEVIGIVTSPTGAVIRDILHRLGERFPRRVLLWPVLVQGELAAEQVAAAIGGFNALPPGGAVPRPDLLIVARGGGSLEDLWAFNEEVVVRAAAASAIPLIAAVGHETDTTLIDLAADRRAPTPTAAAELAVPVRAELALRLGQCEQRMLHGLQRELRQLEHRVVGLARGLPDPVSLVGQASQRLDDLSERLPHGLAARIERAGLTLAEVGARLGSPTRLIAHAESRLRPCAEQLRYLLRALLRERGGDLRRLAARLRLDELGRRLPRQARLVGELAARQEHAVQRAVRDASERLRACGSLLESLSYQGVLARGFALVRDERGGLVASAARARTQVALEIEFHDGRVRTLRNGGRGPSRAQPDDGEQKRLL